MKVPRDLGFRTHFSGVGVEVSVEPAPDQDGDAATERYATSEATLELTRQSACCLLSNQTTVSTDGNRLGISFR